MSTVVGGQRLRRSEMGRATTVTGNITIGGGVEFARRLLNRDVALPDDFPVSVNLALEVGAELFRCTPYGNQRVLLE